MKKDEEDHLKRTIEDLTRTLEDLQELADDASSSRKRDAWVPYLAAMLPVFRDMKQRKMEVKETKKMLKISGVKNGDRLRHPIRKMIAATSKINEKTASKMTLALRYGYRKNWKNVARELKKMAELLLAQENFPNFRKGENANNTSRQICKIF